VDYLFSVLAGIVQGLTEFLPVSSSGHLVLFHDILKFEFFDNVLYDVILHLATLVALVVFFRREVVRIVRGFFASLRHWDLKKQPDQRLAWFLVLALLPAVAVGLAFGSVIETTLRSPYIVAGALWAVAGLFFVAERAPAQAKDIGGMTAADAGTVGLAQVLAFVPGVSRSGITLVAGLARKVKRAEAARFTFLLSIPTILGADLKEAVTADWAQADWAVLGLGFAAALVSGFLTIGFFLSFARRHTLRPFAWYRIGLLVWLVAFRT
jgi:undecaprenyl-diphosphatase